MNDIIIIQMIIHLLLFCLFSILLIATGLPYIIKAALRRYFSTVQMTVYSPFSVRGIMLNGNTKSWGLQRLSIYLSSIQLKFVPNKFKLRLNITNLQVFLSRKLISLVPVNLIDGSQEANILYNFLNYIDSQDFRTTGGDYQSEKRGKKPKQKSTFRYFFQGILHLLMLLIMHTLEVNLIDFKAFVVTGMPEKELSFETNEERRKSLILMQCFSQYSLGCDVITVKATIEQHNSYKLHFGCQQIVCNSYLHWKNTFIQVSKIQLEIKIPFSLSVQKSFLSMQFKISIDEGFLNLVPTDFDHFFQFIKEIGFNPYRKPKTGAPQEEQSRHKVEIYIRFIKVGFEEIYEADYDNKEAKQYLTNVNNATATLEELIKDENGFSIKMSTLSIRKYKKDQASSQQQEVFNLPNLNIKNYSDSALTQITHDEVTVFCNSEELAVIGKLFSIINSRIRFQNYNEDIYRDIIKDYVKGGTIISQMEKMLSFGRPVAEDQANLLEKKQSRLTYTPKKIQIYIDMVKLRHKISIEGFSYNRYYGFNEMSHEIAIKKSTVEYKQFKEFIVSDFRLTFSLTEHQNHLALLIQDITMNQNEETLIDYFDSFTLFKHLLQFESDQEKKVTKFSKKDISILQVTLNFGKQTLSLNTLTVNKETHIKQHLDSIYFSLEKSSLLLTRLKHEKKLFKPYVCREATIFAFDALSIKQGFQIRNNKPIQKVNFILKEPCFTLPEVNITSRIIEYLDILKHMDTHIQAFLKNVSNQKLKFLKYKIKQFLDQPPILVIILTKVKFVIADNKLNQALICFSRTIREDLSSRKKYNEAQMLSILRRNSKLKYLLLETDIQKIRVQLSPIKQLEPNQKSIDRWVSQFLDRSRKIPEQEPQQHRIKQIKAGNLEIKLKAIKIKIRDYPLDILGISQIHFQGSMMRVIRIFGDKSNYVKGSLQVGQFDMNIGLNQLSGFTAIVKRINEFSAIQNAAVSTGNTSIKQKKTFLFRILQSWKWIINFQKPSMTLIKIFTGINPYDKEHFQVQIGKIKAQSQYKSTKVQIEGFQMRFRDFDIVILPKLEVKFVAFLNKGQFAFDLITVVSEEAEFNMSSNLFKYIEELGQLRKDWLLIYGIYEKTLKNQEIQMQDFQNMNYLQIANLLITESANHQSKSSFLNLINQIKINGIFKSVKVSLIQQDLQLSVMAVKASTYVMIKPNHDLYNRFEVIRSNIAAQKLITLFAKENKMGQTIIESRVPTELIERFKKKKEGIIYPFLTCNNICVNFNWYFVEKTIVGRANVWISVGQIQGQVSKKIQRYWLKLFQTFETSRMSVKKQAKIIKQKPLSKFRNAVLEVILINRRNKIKKGQVKKFKVAFDLQRYKLTLKNYDKQMVLSSNNKASFYLSTQYSDTDMYHAKPEDQILLMFPQSVVSLNDKTQNGGLGQIMTIQTFKMEIHKAQDDKQSDFINWGHCSLENINVHLNSQSKNFLNDFIEFIVSISSTSQGRRRVYREEMEKYSEFKNKKVEKIKQKIQWAQSDLKYNQKQLFRWNFTVSNLNLILQNENGKLLSVFVDSTKVSLNLFSNTRADRKIILKKIGLTNELQSEDSEYRHILNIGEEAASLTAFLQTYDVPAFSEVLWRFFKEISIEMEPLRVKMTQQLVEAFIAFLDKPAAEDQDIENELLEYRQKTPDYFKLLNMQPMSFQLWFKSSNIIKRLRGVKVSLDRYRLENKLYTKKQMRNHWIVWIAKQLSSQLFSVLGQKLFGDGQS